MKDLQEELGRLANNDQAEECFRMLARNACVYQQELLGKGATPQLADQLTFQMNEIYLKCYLMRAFGYAPQGEEE